MATNLTKPTAAAVGGVTRRGLLGPLAIAIIGLSVLPRRSVAYDMQAGLRFISEFFELLSDAKFAEAYARTTDRFKQERTVAQLEEFARSRGLVGRTFEQQARNDSWTKSRSRNGSGADSVVFELSGTITNPQGKQFRASALVLLDAGQALLDRLELEPAA